MKRDTLAELRILSGVHAGAREVLAAGEHVIGSDAKCDFVLADAGLKPQHARLAFGNDAWQVHWLGEEGSAPVQLAPGTAVALGPVVITIAPSDAPWARIDQLKLLRAEAGPVEPTLEEEPVAQPVATAAPAAPAVVTAAAPRAARKRGPLVAVIAIGVLLAGAVIAWSTSRPPPETVAATALPVTPPAAQKKAIDAILQQQGLATRARVEPAGAIWRVRADFLDEDELETLAVALSRLAPRPALHTTSEQELRDEVAERVARIAAETDATLAADYQGARRFVLKGRLPNLGDRERVLSQLRGAFPQVADWGGTQLQVSEEMAAALLTELRNAGWEAAGEWKDARLAIAARIPQDQAARWEQGLARAVARNDVPMRAEVTWLAAGTRAGAPHGRLPFEIRSVMGGDAPYLVLADGQKLLPGGERQGWRLLSVDADSLTFEHAGTRAVLPR